MLKAQIEFPFRYMTSAQLCAAYGITDLAFRQLLWRARRAGVALPPRKRVMRKFIYDASAFSVWLWTNAELLKGEYVRDVETEENEEDE